MATLRAAIDARGATRGAREFDRAAKKIKRSSGDTTKSIESGFSSAMRRIMIFGGAGGAVYMLKKFIDSASDAQETMNKFNVVFKENRKEAALWAETFGDSVGRATQDVQKWMAGLQDLFVPLGFARKEAMGLSQDLTKLAVDVASFNNKADADVIRDFTSALVGNHETVRKFGIIISETALKQEAYNQGIKKSYKELSDLEKVHLRLSLIQKGTTDAQGDAVRSMDDYANQVKRAEANWTELKTILGGPAMDALSDILVSVNKNDEAMKRWAENMAEGFEMSLPGAKALFGILSKIADLAPIRIFAKGFDEAVYQRFPEHKTQYMPSNQPQIMSDEDVWLRQIEQREQAEQKNEFVGPLNVSDKERAAATKAANDLVVRQTRDAMESVREQDYLTRMERIQNLEAYRATHADVMYDTVGKETEAGRLIRDEILSVQRSRLDAMKVYHAELQEDFEDSSLYISERFADTAHSIEGSMGNAFFSMISEGASWKDAMTGFFRDVGRAFGQMASEMMARAVMMKAVGVVMGGGGGGDLNPESGSPTMPDYSAESAYGNVFNRGRLVPMASGAILNRPTYFPLAGGNTGLMGEAGPEAIMPLRRGRGGRLGVEASKPNVTVNPTPVKIIFVRNDREAQIEAMRSEEGQSEIANTVLDILN